MTALMRVLALCCFLAVVVLAGWGGYLALDPGAVDSTSTAPATVAIENPDRDLGDVSIGEHPVVFRIVNPTAKQVRVVCSPGVCCTSCCLGPKETAELVVPPGETAEVTWVLNMVKPLLPFSLRAEVYAIGESTWVLPISIQGIGVAPPVKPS